MLDRPEPLTVDDVFVVAVDGPSGSGKSSVSRRAAQALGARYLDTGAMYRAATWSVLEAGVATGDFEAVASTVAGIVLEVATDPVAPTVHVVRPDGSRTDVTAAVRSEAVTAAVSAVAAVPAVREQLIAAQRSLIMAAGAQGVVVEGRDIASVVAPRAAAKIYLTASEAARAQRRSGETSAAVAATAAALALRDRTDAATTPSDAAPGAWLLDTSDLDLEQAVAAVVAHAQARR